MAEARKTAKAQTKVNVSDKTSVRPTNSSKSSLALGHARSSKRGAATETPPGTTQESSPKGRKSVLHRLSPAPASPADSPGTKAAKQVSFEEAKLVREREEKLETAAATLDLRLVTVPGDGNCVFHALKSFSKGRTAEWLRDYLTDYLLLNFEVSVIESFDSQLKPSSFFTSKDSLRAEKENKVYVDAQPYMAAYARSFKKNMRLVVVGDHDIGNQILSFSHGPKDGIVQTVFFQSWMNPKDGLSGHAGASRPLSQAVSEEESATEAPRRKKRHPKKAKSSSVDNATEEPATDSATDDEDFQPVKRRKGRRQRQPKPAADTEANNGAQKRKSQRQRQPAYTHLYGCNDCESDFQTEDELDDHTTAEHDGNLMQQVSNDRNVIKPSGKSGKKGSKTLTVSIPSSGEESDGSVRVNLVDNKAKKCVFCKSFFGQKKMVIHVKDVHQAKMHDADNKSLKPAGIQKCDHCAKPFPLHGGYAKHKTACKRIRDVGPDRHGTTHVTAAVTKSDKKAQEGKENAFLDSLTTSDLLKQTIPTRVVLPYGSIGDAMLFRFSEIAARVEAAAVDSTEEARASKLMFLYWQWILGKTSSGPIQIRELRKRWSLFREGNWQELHKLTCGQGRSILTSTNDEASKAKRAKLKIGAGNLSKGAEALRPGKAPELLTKEQRDAVLLKFKTASTRVDSAWDKTGTTQPEEEVGEALRMKILSFQKAVEKATREAENDVAPGPSGLRNEHVKAMIKANKAFLQPVAKLLYKWSNNKAGKAVKELFTGALITAVEKDDGSRRPIAPTESLIKAMTKAVTDMHRPELNEMLKDHQYGCGVKGGQDKIRTAAALALEVHPDWIVLMLDLKNGYGMASRALVDKALEDTPHLRSVHAFMYDHSNTLFIPLKDAGESNLHHMKDGYLQGDPGSPFWFSISIADAVKQAQRDHQATVVRFFLDDGSLMGPPDKVFAVYTAVKQAMAQVGHEISCSKTKICLGADATADTVMQLAPMGTDFDTVTPAKSIIVLGVPIGNVEECKQTVNNMVDEALTDMARIKALDDNQKQYLLLRFVHTGKITHLLRGSVPEATEDGSITFDNGMIEQLEGIASAKLSNKHKLQMILPSLCGGLSLFSTKRIAKMAFLAQLNDFCQDIDRLPATLAQEIKAHICDPGGTSIYNRAVADACKHLSDILEELIKQLPEDASEDRKKALDKDTYPVKPEDLFNPAKKRKQCELARLTSEIAWEEFRKDMTDEEDIRITSLRGPLALKWLETIPDQRRRIWKSYNFMLSIRKTLGIPWELIDEKEHKCVDSAKSTPTEQHLQSCSEAGGNQACHQRLRDTFKFYAELGGNTVKIKGTKTHADAKGYTDLVINMASGPVSVDVSVVNAHTRTMPLQAVENKITEKHATYQREHDEAGVKFVAVVYDHYGGSLKETDDFFDLLAKTIPRDAVKACWGVSPKVIFQQDVSTSLAMSKIESALSLVARIIRKKADTADFAWMEGSDYNCG